MRISRLIGAITASAVLSGSAAAAPPANPELNPLFAAEWWLRGHTTLVTSDGESMRSDGVDAIRAWQSSTGTGVVVAVADSGVDARTPALAGQLLPGRNFLTGNRVIRDPLGHGTHVATLISGNPTQSDGIFGVAPESRILPLRVATAGGHVPVAAAATALAYASRDPRVRVVNMSWKKEFSASLERALAAAATRTSLLLVSAAGNDARDLAGSGELPQTFDSESELTVASTDILDHLSWFSNYGKHVEVAAPGERILSASGMDTLKIDDGTSMAAPIVSGVAALLFSRYPTASAMQVKQAIVASCTPVAALVGRVDCGGIVNAPAALATLGAMLQHTGATRSSDGRDPGALAQAARIRAEVDARYRRPRRVRLAVTEASSTGVIDSFTLFTGRASDPRVVPAANGIYYALCPVGATCPYPGRAAQPPGAFLPRRAALELAVRTFLETSADLVAVLLPTRRFVLLILERADVIGRVDAPALHAALRTDPAAAPDPSLRRIVDDLTRPRLYAPSALIPVSDTRETLVASSLFP
jgi:Subtilase family